MRRRLTRLVLTVLVLGSLAVLGNAAEAQRQHVGRAGRYARSPASAPIHVRRLPNNRISVGEDGDRMVGRITSERAIRGGTDMHVTFRGRDALRWMKSVVPGLTHYSSRMRMTFRGGELHFSNSERLNRGAQTETATTGDVVFYRQVGASASR